MTSEIPSAGERRIEEVFGPGGARALPDPDGTGGALTRHVVNFVFGEVYRGDRLTLRERQLVTVAALAALGGTEPQLKVHLQAALRAGATLPELEETLVQIAPYAGFPRAFNAAGVLRACTATEPEAEPEPSAAPAPQL